MYEGTSPWQEVIRCSSKLNVQHLAVPHFLLAIMYRIPVLHLSWTIEHQNHTRRTFMVGADPIASIDGKVLPRYPDLESDFANKSHEFAMRKQN